MAVEVKICGLTTLADVEAVNAAGADYAGFVFYEKSKRRIDEKEAEHLLASLDPAITSVAVCVSPDAERIARMEALGFSVIQIHGEIPPDLLNAVRIPVWQAVNLSDRAQLETILLHPKIAGYLIDSAEYGGGKSFGWENADAEARHAEEPAVDPVAGERPEQLREEIRRRTGGKRFILAGGLTPENVNEGIRLFAPDVVDVSSGVEWTADEAADAAGVEWTADGVADAVGEERKTDGTTGAAGARRGRKDPDRVMEFVRKVREA